MLLSFSLVLVVCCWLVVGSICVFSSSFLKYNCTCIYYVCLLFFSCNHTKTNNNNNRYETTKGNTVLRLSIPTDLIENKEEYEAYEKKIKKENEEKTNSGSTLKKRKVGEDGQTSSSNGEHNTSAAAEEKPILPMVTFDNVMNEYTKEEIFDFRHGTAKRTLHFQTFSKYLWIQINRYT